MLENVNGRFNSLSIFREGWRLQTYNSDFCCYKTCSETHQALKCIDLSLSSVFGGLANHASSNSSTSISGHFHFHDLKSWEMTKEPLP